MNLPGIQWSPGEAAALNDFLNSPLGMKLLRVSYFLKPRLDLSTTERAALSGAFAAGYEAMLNELANLRTTLPQEPPGLKGIDPTKD